MQQSLADHLRKCLPAGAVLDEPLSLSLYGYDGTFYEGLPQLALLPETTEQVVEAVRACREAGVPLVARGAATSLSGGPVPVKGGAVVSFTRMDRVLKTDTSNRFAVVQPGVINLDFQKALAKQKFFYAPDPASQSVCTLGGNIGENSGGPHCLKYGVTANHILGLTVVLPDGRILHTGGFAPDSPGYDLTGIFVGSEGTFGLVTEINCRIFPLPESVVTMLAIFDRLNDASQSVSDIIADGIIPATLEMMDRSMIQAVEKALQAGYPLDAEAVLIIELDGLKSSTGLQVAQVEKSCRRNSVRSFQVAENEEQRALLWKGRKGAFGAVVNIAPSKICTDVSVPRSELPKVLTEVVQTGEKWGVPITNVFHAGDGNLHPLILFDPRDEDQVRRAREVDREITALAVKYGGVLTGEHGIGCGKRQYMRSLFSPSELHLMWRIKKAFDPENLCNPDKVLPDKSEIPVAGQKSNPAAFPDPDQQYEPGVKSVDSIAFLLAAARKEKRKVVLQGAGTKSGLVPDGAEVLNTGRLNRIVSHDRENLTITVECGAGLEQIDAELAPHKQMLALRPRFAGKASIGGIIASNDSGPHRLLYGSLRDLLLGIKAALPNGEIVSFGGKCVKNVAGYAVEKLFIGSRGSLGAILEATFRTLPQPEVCRTLSLPLDSPRSAEAFLQDLFSSGLKPAAMELLNPAASRYVDGREQWRLLAGLEGFPADVEETAGRLTKMAEKHALEPWRTVETDYIPFWRKVTDLSDSPTPMLEVTCPLTSVAGIAEELNAQDSSAPIRATAGLGLIFCSAPSEPSLYEQFARTLIQNPGFHTWWLPPLPDGLKSSPEGVPLEICQRLKKAFDPDGVLAEAY